MTMRRLVLFLGLMAIIIAIPATHDVFAAKMDKVSICHVNSSNTPGERMYSYGYEYDYANPDYTDYTYWYTQTWTYHLGREISVNGNAVEDHVAHGDSTSYSALGDMTAASLESLENGNNFYEYSYDYGYMVYSYWRGYQNTNAVVTNANCYWVTYEFDASYLP